MDAIGSRGGLARLGPELRAAGAEVLAVMPLRLWGHNAARLDLRNHRKIAIVDGAVAYFGSQNIVDAHANPGLVNEELAVRATGPIVRHLHAVLLADRFLEVDNLPPEVDLRTPWTGNVAPGGWAQTLPSGPGYTEGTAEAVMIALMYGASSRVVLTAPYVVPSVDDDLVLIGSSNLDIRSFALNAEVSVMIRDAGVAVALRDVQARYRQNALPVTVEERARRKPVRRTLENLARLTDSVL